jgi:hypothetical protein
MLHGDVPRLMHIVIDSGLRQFHYRTSSSSYKFHKHHSYVSHADNKRPETRRRDGSNTENLLLFPTLRGSRRIFRSVQIWPQKYANHMFPSLPLPYYFLIRLSSIRVVSPTLPSSDTSKSTVSNCKHTEARPHNCAFTDCPSRSSGIELLTLCYHTTGGD